MNAKNKKKEQLLLYRSEGCKDARLNVSEKKTKGYKIDMEVVGRRWRALG
jgi:hypothetical protein